MAITKIVARSVYDSRGNPTVQVSLHDENGEHVATVPSGASTGAKEAHELRDGDKSKWLGKGVTKAVANVNKTLGPELIKSGIRVTDQTAVDELLNKLDGTENKKNLGANALLAVSMAVLRAGAASKKVPLYVHISDLAGTKKPYVLPVPFFNVINGGAHGGGILPFQEFMIVPVGAPSFSEAVRYGAETYQHLKSIAKKKYGPTASNVGDEGGIAPAVAKPEEALDLITEAIKMAGHEGKMKIALDVAASEFFIEEEGVYDLDIKRTDGTKHNKIKYDALAKIYKDLTDKYPIVSIEDGFDQAELEAWSYFSKTTDIQIVGDDLTCTNPKLVQMAEDSKACNALLLKVNQIGTISEAIAATKLSYSMGWGVMTSHRSGESEDTLIADLVVGLRTGQIKSGATCRSERVAKYNRLLRIEEDLGKDAVYAGANFRNAVNM